MKTKIFSLVFVLCVLLIPKAVFAESVTAFSSNVKINPDSTISITETINYDFGTVPHHGIYRDIPYHYNARGGNYDVRISIASVTDENDQPYQYTTSKSNGELDIKIGDPNSTITGAHTYVIKYSVAGAVNFFSDHDELYWNVTGNDWQVPMATTSASVVLPTAVGKNDLQIACYSGPVGSTQSCENSIVDPLTGQIKFLQTKLAANEGLTIVVGFPKGLVTQPTFWQRLLWTLQDNWGLGLPVIVFILMFLLWYKKGRDPKGFETIVPQYEPPVDLTPTEVGTVLDESASNKDISAEIINLAAGGYIKITKLQDKILGLFNHTDYQLDLLKDAGDLKNQFEKTIVSAIFGSSQSVKLSELKNKFYFNLATIQKQIFQGLIDRQYFPSNPQTTRIVYGVLAAFVGVIGFWCGIAFQNLYTILGAVASAIIITIFAHYMPKRTAKGAEAKQYILGLKMYLSVAEKDRLKFFNAPAATPEVFEKLLPYAMVLGVENEWAKQFEGIYNQPPRWYYDPYGGPFSTYLFVNSLHGFSQSAGTAFTSRPGGSSAAGGSSGFGGGGFSGGGFGGGGGGGW